MKMFYASTIVVLHDQVLLRIHRMDHWKKGYILLYFNYTSINLTGEKNEEGEGKKSCNVLDKTQQLKLLSSQDCDKQLIKRS